MNNQLKNILLTPFSFIYRIAPKYEMQLLYFLKHRRWLNLSNPETYNEKLNWLKLFYRDDLMPKCADKYAARDYIEHKGYGSLLPKLYWHGNNFDEIPFECLPNSFVVKSTSGSGNNIIVRDKSKLNLTKTNKIINRWLKEKYLIAYGEWHYMKIKPSIIIEEFLCDGINEVPVDYKMFCFNNYPGSVLCTAVDTDRFIKHRRDIYDNQWNHLNVKMKFPQSGKLIPKPKFYNDMCEIASVLSKPFPHARIDFFVVGDRFYIGEITFFNGAGFDLVTPYEFNKQMGDAIKLPLKNNI